MTTCNFGNVRVFQDLILAFIYKHASSFLVLKILLFLLVSVILDTIPSLKLVYEWVIKALKAAPFQYRDLRQSRMNRHRQVRYRTSKKKGRECRLPLSRNLIHFRARVRSLRIPVGAGEIQSQVRDRGG